jgi:hypothetical protein
MSVNYTLTYSEGSKGFPSFYSYFPDFMIGMNQFFYTFKNGNLYRHNTNTVYNQFYGVDYPSTISSVFNENPLENKLFKTINLESDDSWEAHLETDIQDTGYIDDEWFVQKEADWFAFVRNDGQTGANVTESEFELRSLNGIANSLSVSGPQAAQLINFPLTVGIGSIISVGDNLYFAEPPVAPVTTYTPVFAGVVTNIIIDKANDINQLVVDSTVAGATFPIPIQDAYFLFIKNPIAESHGVLGHYCEFKLELKVGKAQSASELFAVESEVMKSFP